MSNNSFSDSWLESGNGPGSSARPGFSRYDARNALIRHHNYRGESVFLAARRWHHARAQTHATKLRLDRALREANDAEQAELKALVGMGIGQRSAPGSGYLRSRTDLSSVAVSVARPGGHREKVEKRLAAEAAEAPPVRKFTPGSRSRSPPLAKTGVDATPAKAAGSEARSSWMNKMQGTGLTAADAQPAVLEVKKPRRGASKGATKLSA